MEQTRKRCVLLRFWKREPVLCIAAVCAAASVALNPPSADYLNYIDWRVLSLLFCLPFERQCQILVNLQLGVGCYFGICPAK